MSSPLRKKRLINYSRLIHGQAILKFQTARSSLLPVDCDFQVSQVTPLLHFGVAGRCSLPLRAEVRFTIVPLFKRSFIVRFLQCQTSELTQYVVQVPTQLVSNRDEIAQTWKRWPMVFLSVWVCHRSAAVDDDDDALQSLVGVWSVESALELFS